MQQATTIKRFRSHPLYIVSILWKYLFILLVPVIRRLYYVIINSFSLENGFQFAVNISNWAKGAWMDIVFLLAFLSLGVLLWLSFTIEVSEEGLLIKRGVLKREVRFLPVSRYNCLSMVSPMSVRLFGGVYLRVDTPGGGLKQADLLMLLRTKDCRQIIKLLQLPDSLEQPAHTRSYTPKNRYVFVLAMVTSNSFAGVLLISTFVTQAGNILGEQFSEMLYGTFENVTRTLAFGVPPAAFALACILFFGYLCAFVVSLSRHANFHVIRRKNLLEVRAGLLTKRSYRIAADKIAYLDIRRSLLTCLLGVYSIFLSTVGYGKFKDDVSALIPCVRKKQLERSLQLLLPEYHLSQRTAKPNRLRSAGRYIWRSAALLGLVWAGRWLLLGLFPNWEQLIRWVSFMATFPLVWLLVVKVIDLFTAGVSYERGCYTLRYSKGFSLHQVIIRPERIVKLKVSQSIFQKRKGRCDLRLFSYGEGRKIHHIRDLEQKQVEQLFDCKEESADKKDSREPSEK